MDVLQTILTQIQFTYSRRRCKRPCIQILQILQFIAPIQHLIQKQTNKQTNKQTKQKTKQKTKNDGTNRKLFVKIQFCLQLQLYRQIFATERQGKVTLRALSSVKKYKLRPHQIKFAIRSKCNEAYWIWWSLLENSWQILSGCSKRSCEFPHRI